MCRKELNHVSVGEVSQACLFIVFGFDFDFFVFFSFGSSTLHSLMYVVFRALYHCTLERKRKASLARQKSASPPQNPLSQNEGGRGPGRRGGEGESSSVHSNNSPSQLSCNDVSFLITNCLFMLQQLPRAANKWLKECLDQAFRPLLFAGCYLVDSDGYSCLVWKRARDGEAVIDRRALGVRHSRPRWPHGFMFPALKGKRWLCLEVGGERKCLRVMGKIL